jgi:peptidoglycan/LPS O-acetylase OafA/YrhL
MIICVLSYRRRRWAGFVLTLFIITVVAGFFLAVGGTTAQTPGGLLVSVVGMMCILGLVLVLGALPHVIIASRKLRSV